MKTLPFFTLLFSLLLTPLWGQVTGEVDRVKAQYISETERLAVTPEMGLLLFDEADASKLYIGNGSTVGGVRVSPPDGTWDYSATQDIYLNGYRLHFGNGFSLIGLGGFSALSGNGEILAQGAISRWGTMNTAFIRLNGGDTLGQITSFTWDPAEEEFTLTITDIDGGTPTIETTDDLVTGDWVAHAATVTGPVGGVFTAVFDDPGGGMAFFRAVYPAPGDNKIELLMPVEIPATLSVTGAITGPLNVTNLVGKVTSAQIADAVTEDIAEGVTAHGWGDHAAAGYLTEQSTVYTVGFFEAPEDDDLDWLLIARAAVIDDVAPGQAYCRVIHTAETTYTITKNGGASLGTVVFPDDGNVGVITLSADITLAAGDRLEFRGPATADVTGADIQVSLIGVLQ